MKNKKILIVDDDPQIAESLEKHLSAAGATVLTASSFETGIESIRKNAPDAVITDVMMPGRSGLDLVREIRALPGPHPFVMILTNSINAEHIADAMESNVTTFVQKADHDPAEIVDMLGKRLAEEKKS